MQLIYTKVVFTAAKRILIALEIKSIAVALIGNQFKLHISSQQVNLI